MNKDKLKNETLTIEDIHIIITELGGEPMPIEGDKFISRTICHNGSHDGGYHLWYYENTHGFYCYTECGYMDIFEVVSKVLNCELPQAIRYVCNLLGIEYTNEELPRERLADWDILDKLIKRQNPVQKSNEFKVYDETVLKYLPRPRVLDWEREYITKDVMDLCGIAYNPSSESIVIPHYNIDNQLIGIRERTLIKENEKYGKYRPAVIGGIQYNHSLGHNLYGINVNKDIIEQMKTAIVFESEKAVLQSLSYGCELGVSCCGSSISIHQINILKQLGVNNLIIAFDKEFHQAGYWDEEWKAWTNKLKKLHNKYSLEMNVSFIFDKYDKLGYKDAPTDKGKDIFYYLLERRVSL